MDVAVDLDDVLRARGAVEAVDVLRQDNDPGRSRSSVAIAAWARLGRAPRQARSMAPRYFQVHSGRRASVSPERRTSIGSPSSVASGLVEPADASVRREARVCRDPRAGHEQDRPCRARIRAAASTAAGSGGGRHGRERRAARREVRAGEFSGPGR